MNFNATESNIISKFNFRDLIIFLVPILLFSLYLFVYNPGVLTVASYSQLHQIATGQFTNAHPMFHTLLEMICIKLFKSPFYIGLFQILIFSAMWMIICKYHRNDLANSSDEFVLQFIVTLIICLIPINAVYSVTLSSNVLFSYAVMFLCFLIKVMIDNDGQIDTKMIIIMALTIAIMSGLSTYGIYVALISLIVVLYYLFKRGMPKNKLTVFAGIAIVCILIIGSLSFIFDVSNDTIGIQTDDAFEDGVNLENAKNHFFSLANEKPTEGFENMTSSNLRNSNYNLIDSFVNLFRETLLFDAFFNSPLFCMFLSILLLVSIKVTTQKTEIYLIYVPPLINMIMTYITGQNNQYSNLLVFYLIIIICIGLYFKLSLKPKDLINITQTIAKRKENVSPSIVEPEKIEAQQQIQQEETYVNDTYYSDLETEIEELSLEEINEMLGKSPVDENQEESAPAGDSDLIDEILKEIEMEKE